jgi:hypothetical protein
VVLLLSYRKLQTDIRDTVKDRRIPSDHILSDVEDLTLPYQQSDFRQGPRIFPPVSNIKVAASDRPMPSGDSGSFSVRHMMREEGVISNESTTIHADKNRLTGWSALL